MAEVEVAVLKDGREIDRVFRPLRESADGPAVTYRRKLWPFRQGSIDLDGRPASSGIEVPEPEVSSAGFDEDQKSVVEGESSARMLVDAGPGTGKTHVACAKVAALVADGVPATRIWLISFTRTAVVELRNRIANALADPDKAAGVRIATLDSHAWALQSGFSADAKLGSGFDDNIEQTLQRVNDDQDLRDYLSRVRHLLIDEAQDIVGVRANLSLALIEALDQDCGVTVFYDAAQAIYGFTEEKGDGSDVGPALYRHLIGLGFQQLSLKRVHRTSKPNLKTIFTNVRAQVLREAGSVSARRRRVEHEIRRLADDDGGKLTDLKLSTLSENALVLMRNRAEVLLISSMEAGIPHRLRMSGLPSCVRPWVGTLLWDYTGTRLAQNEFETIWLERLVGDLIGTPPLDIAWQRLLEVAGETSRTIDLRRLREVLSRSAPPMLFCSPEFGDRGPVLGTIHASKGREADEVLLYLPSLEPNGDGRQDPDEEIRVMFVGATRAREHLRVGVGVDCHAGNATGRCWRWVSSKQGRKRVQIEVGRSHDLDCMGLVGQRVFNASSQAQVSQKFWLNSTINDRLHARSDRDLDWQFMLESQGNQRLAMLSARFNSDLRDISRQCKQFPPIGFLPHLRSVGVRTVVVKPDDPQLELLHEPWRSSGFLFAPLLIGFSTASFPGSSNGQ